VHLSLASLVEAARHASPQCPPFTLSGDAQLHSVSTDSRTLRPGALYVALRGERFDGHAFIDQAVQAGAAALLLCGEHAAAQAGYPVPCAQVPDTLAALGALCRGARSLRPEPVVAITGSNGKTTTKELVAAALCAHRTPVHRTSGNLNNAIGLPLSVFAWPQDCWAAVLEMGMNAPGEIAYLTELSQPQVGVITCVNRAHLGGPGLGTLEAIAQAKCELFATMAKTAVAVLNSDDALLVKTAAPHLAGRKVIRFGTAASNAVQLLQVQPVASGCEIKLRIDTQICRTTLPLFGAHNAHNAAAAAAAAYALEVPPQTIAQGLAQVLVPAGRLQWRSLRGGTAGVLDDTYNANPDSMQAAFAAAVTMVPSHAVKRRTLAVLGDMLELGPSSPQLHHDTGKSAVKAGMVKLFCLGAQAQEVVAGAQQAGGEATAYPHLEALLAALHSCLQPGDVVLVKGSRGMKMERVVQALLAADVAGNAAGSTATQKGAAN
jgi:UDP-N-acetylmuramoyl-tripeptide--D-alanyl-D-alanine ligase